MAEAAIPSLDLLLHSTGTFLRTFLNLAWTTGSPLREKGLPLGLKGFHPAEQPVSHAARGTSGGI
jgi:hypothetical protein